MMDTMSAIAMLRQLTPIPIYALAVSPLPGLMGIYSPTLCGVKCPEFQGWDGLPYFSVF